MIIGVTGYIKSGKSTAARHIIKEYGFIGHSFGGIVREEAVRRGFSNPNDRDVLQRLGYELKQEFGEEELARRIIERIDLRNGVNYVVDGFRSIHDVAVFRRLPGFALVGIEATFENRLAWYLKQVGRDDVKTRKDFKRADAIDRGIIREEYWQNTDECMRLVDRTIENGGLPYEFSDNVSSIVKELMRRERCLLV